MDVLLLAPVLVASIVIHEVAHAWQARREGDHTAERQGRITLNPLPHLDPVGSVIVPLVLWASGTNFLFGWAKPVPVVPSNFRDHPWGDIRVSLAGIVSNLGLAVLSTLALTAVVVLQPSVASGDVSASIMDGARLMAFYGLYINLILAIFNLAPIPPLDGSHVVYHMLPPGLAERYRAMGRYGLLILMGLLFLVPGAFDVLLWPVDALVGVADSFVRLWI